MLVYHFANLSLLVSKVRFYSCLRKRMCLKSEQEVYPGLHVPVVGKVPLNYGCRVSRQVPLKTIGPTETTEPILSE